MIGKGKSKKKQAAKKATHLKDAASDAIKAPFKADSRPPQFFNRFHKRTRRQVPILQTLLLLCLTPLFALLTRVRVSGRENIPDGGYIVAANHPSTLDPAFVALAVRRRIRFMGKSDVFDKGLKGQLMSRLGAFPVIRGRWDEDAFETAITVVDKGRVMAIFPEGGCSDKDGSFRTARPGIGYVAQRTGATVLPIYIDNGRAMYRPWRFPKVSVIIGEPLQIDKIEEPTRESNQSVAERVLARIASIRDQRRAAA